MNELLFNKTMEKVEIPEFAYLTQEEFDSVLEVNIENEVTINGTKLDGGAYVDLIHQAFMSGPESEEKTAE